MIVIPTAPWAHYLGDIAGWGGATAAAVWQHRHWPAQSRNLARITAPSYYLNLAMFALAGAWLAGSANSLPISLAPSHSIASALAGGIIGVEFWKWRHGVRCSTGGAFVLPIVIGIMIGRLGCLFAGLPDLTFGTATHLPWAVDLGDGIGRHPVEIYEALAMALFAAFYVNARLKNRLWSVQHGFHIFIIYYAAQRSLWEFLKPYPPLIGPLNVFHLLCLGMMIYGFFWLWSGRSGSRFVAGDSGTEVRALCIPQPDDEPLRDLP